MDIFIPMRSALWCSRPLLLIRSPQPPSKAAPCTSLSSASLSSSSLQTGRLMPRGTATFQDTWQEAGSQDMNTALPGPAWPNSHLSNPRCTVMATAWECQCWAGPRGTERQTRTCARGQQPAQINTGPGPPCRAPSQGPEPAVGPTCPSASPHALSILLTVPLKSQ